MLNHYGGNVLLLGFTGGRIARNRVFVWETVICPPAKSKRQQAATSHGYGCTVK